MNAIKLLKEIANELKDSKLAHLKQVSDRLTDLANQLGLKTSEEALLFVPIFSRACEDRATSITDIAWYFGCTLLDIMEYGFALNSLLERGWIYAKDFSEWEESKINYNITPALLSAIMRGEDVCDRTWGQDKEAFDQFDFISMIGGLTESRRHNNKSTKQLLNLLEEREKLHAHLPLFQLTKELELSSEERLLFYVLAYDKTKGEYSRNSDVDNTLSVIYDTPSQRIKIKRSLIERSHTLIRQEMMELSNDNDDMQLSDLGLERLLGEDASLYVKPTINLDRYEFVDAIYEVAEGDNKPTKIHGSHQLISKMRRLEVNNRQLAFIEKLSNDVTNPMDRFLFYLVAHEFKDGDTLSFNSRDFTNCYESRDLMEVKRDLKAEKHTLQKLHLVELTPATLFNDGGLTLSEKGKGLYLEEDIDLFEEQVKDKDLIDPKDIKEKKLFFGYELEHQLGLVRNSLEENNYKNLTKRLAAQSMPQGIAVLMYGLPGTGKTESVLQIAKATGRSVLHVDISATKTCWFGESEKLIKKVFTNYRRLCQKSKLKPILLFNEADAVFGKRKDANSSSVAQTENAIQNIILEEMENLEGILIATTNLADNLDGAFERRFLFKIRFDQPSVEARSKIWTNKLSMLTDTEANRLAAQYNFSGGEIDNIARKAIMQEVVTGDAPTFVSLNQLCEQEKLTHHTAKPIGFR